MSEVAVSRRLIRTAADRSRMGAGAGDLLSRIRPEERGLLVKAIPQAAGEHESLGRIARVELARAQQLLIFTRGGINAPIRLGHFSDSWSAAP